MNPELETLANTLDDAVYDLNHAEIDPDTFGRLTFGEVDIPELDRIHSLFSLLHIAIANLDSYLEDSK
jgi:hypothetical protein